MLKEVMESSAALLLPILDAVSGFSLPPHSLEGIHTHAMRTSGVVGSLIACLWWGTVLVRLGGQQAARGDGRGGGIPLLGMWLFFASFPVRQRFLVFVDPSSHPVISCRNACLDSRSQRRVRRPVSVPGKQR